MTTKWIFMAILLMACDGSENSKQNSASKFGQTDGVWKFMTEAGCKTGEEVIGKSVTPSTLEEWGCIKMQEQGPRRMYDCSNVPSLQKYFVMTQEKC